MIPSTGRARLLAFLRTGRSITTRQATRFGLTPDSTRARISEFRKAGLAIYTNDHKGRVAYRMGTPTRREVAAGKLVLNDPYLSQYLKAEIEANLALVN